MSSPQRPIRIHLQHTPQVAGDFDTNSLDRYRRHWLINGIGPNGQARIRAAKVLVVGAGGLGSPVLQYLAAAGVGTIGIADSDVVEVSNLQRQLLHSEHDVGINKGVSARSHLSALNSEVSYEIYGAVDRDFLDSQGSSFDLIMDCTDNFDTKYLLADWCADHGMPLVWGTVVATTYQVSCFWTQAPAPVPPTSLRMLHPNQPQPGTTPVATSVGVLGPVVGQAGTIMATEALKLIVGFGKPLLGRVLVCDAATLRTDILTFATWEH